MLKVNSAVLHEAEEQLLAQYRAINRISEKLETARRALLADGDTFYLYSTYIENLRCETDNQATRLKQMAGLADSLLTLYARCERESSNPTLDRPGAPTGELFRSADAPAGGYIAPEQIQTEFNELIGPLISN